MPTIRDARAVAAGATVTNLLAGSKFEFMATDSVVEVYARQDGAAATEVLMDVSFGNVLEGDQVVVPTTATAGEGPLRDQDKLISAVAAGGDRIQIKVQNTAAAAASNLRTLVIITEL